MPAIEFTDVSVEFEERLVLDRVSLNLTEHRIGIIGANGSGKSTLARLINGLGEPTSGTVREVRRKVGFIFSDADNQIVMPSVIDDVAFSLRRMRLPRAERRERARAALERFGLAGHADQSPHLLSGGQKQLLALTAVLVTEPETVIADEPTTLLDLRNRRMIHDVFAGLDQQLIVVTHDLDLVADADRVIYLGDGGIVADGEPRETIARYVADMER